MPQPGPLSGGRRRGSGHDCADLDSPAAHRGGGRGHRVLSGAATASAGDRWQWLGADSAVHRAAGAGRRIFRACRRHGGAAAAVPGGADKHPNRPERSTPGRPAMSAAWRKALFGLGLLLLLAPVVGVAFHMPSFGDHPLPYGDAINEGAPRDRHVSNAVSAVNFDYRGFDTLG